MCSESEAQSHWRRRSSWEPWGLTVSETTLAPQQVQRPGGEEGGRGQHRVRKELEASRPHMRALGPPGQEKGRRRAVQVVGGAQVPFLALEMRTSLR